MASAEGRKASSYWTELLSQTKGPRKARAHSPAASPHPLQLSLHSGLPLAQGVVRAEPSWTKASVQAFHGRGWLWPFSRHSGHSEVKSFTEFQPQACSPRTWEGRSQQGQPSPAARTGAKGLTKAAVLIKCPKFLVLPPMGSASGKCQR